MGFDRLLGNDRLKENLHRSLKQGHISHFYLISGPIGSGKHTLARLLAAAILCQGEDKPCLSCPACRKVTGMLHPDLITVEDPEHKNVAVKIVRQFREDVFIRPNEAEYKIYLFPQELGTEGQNALLKILEEPPSYAVFILLTDNPEKLLPTVRSRCTELSLTSLQENTLRSALSGQFPDASSDAVNAAIARSGGFLGQAIQILSGADALLPQTERFAQCFAEKDALGIVQTLVPMEKWKRDALLPALEQWLDILTQALSQRSGIPAVSPAAGRIGTQRSGPEIMAAVTHIRKCADFARQNVSPAAICNYLSWHLRSI
ncbi:MAG: hypothetical protein E7433_06805 [Ruminococcaceae bacterium]|nr:hypothetical protein [Oscillospiraceae bacterium]